MIDFRQYLTNYRDVIDKEVAGYFYPIDMILFYAVLRYAQQNMIGDICEIGVAKGKSAICLSNFKRQEEKFFLFDNFSEQDKQIAIHNIQKYGNYDNFDWRINDTTELKVDDLSFMENLRLLHIDGCHEHWAVLNDLTLFSHFMHDNGVIVADDFNDYEYPGVNSAVNEFCLSKYNYKNWRVFAIGDNKAYLCQKRLRSTYQQLIIDFMEKFNSNPERPFDIKMCLRQVLDVNVLLCDAREQWTIDKIRSNLFNRLVC